MISKFNSCRKSGRKILSQRKKWEQGAVRQNVATSLGNAIRELVDFLDVDDIITEQTAITKWEQVVGEKIAQVAQPKSIKKGILKVKVKNSVWRQELTFMKEDIVQKLNNELHSKIVSEIIFT